jgi:hypothetical protein
LRFVDPCCCLLSCMSTQESTENSRTEKRNRVTSSTRGPQNASKSNNTARCRTTLSRRATQIKENPRRHIYTNNWQVKYMHPPRRLVHTEHAAD